MSVPTEKRTGLPCRIVAELALLWQVSAECALRRRELRRCMWPTSPVPRRTQERRILVVEDRTAW